MTNHMRTKWFLPLAAMTLAILTIPASAQQLVPFKGVLEGRDGFTPPVTFLAGGNGTGTLLGKFTFTHTITVNSPSTGTGTARFVAANGDAIESKSTVSVDMSTQDLGYITITEIHHIIGGTGRFAGMQGSFTVERTHIVEAAPDGTHATFGSIRGSVTSPGAAS